MRNSSAIEPCATSTSEQCADPVVFTASEYRRVLNVCRTDPRTFWYPAAVIAWHTGLKLKTIALLKWDCIDWQQESLTVTVKNGPGPVQTLQIPIHPDLIDLLRARAPTPLVESNYLHPQMAGYYLWDGHKSLSSQFIRICLKAGVVAGSFNALRRTFIRDMVLAGLDNQTLADVTGITDLRRFGRNAAHSFDAKRKALHRLSLYRGGFCQRTVKTSQGGSNENQPL